MGRVIIICSILFTGMAVSLYGQTGSSAVNFLRIEPDARSGGLAGVGSTILDGGYGGYYNPALLGWQRGTVAGFSYSNWLPGVGGEYRYNHVTGGIELDSRSSLAANITYFNLGEQTATDENNRRLGSFSSYQMAAGLSYGRLAGRHFSWGLGGKYIYSNLASGQLVDGEQIEPSGTFAFDGGLMFRSSRWSMGSSSGEVRAGLSLSNVGDGLQYMDGQSKAALPQSFRSGVAIELTPDEKGVHSFTLMADATTLLTRMERKVTASGDTTWSSMPPLRALTSGWGSVERFNGQEMVELNPFEQFGLGAGLEYWYDNLLALRAGYYVEHEDNGGRRFATVGTGLRYGPAEVDFSYLIATQENHPLDGTLRFSLKLHFSKGGYQAPRRVRPRRSERISTFNEMYAAEKATDQMEDISDKEATETIVEADVEYTDSEDSKIVETEYASLDILLEDELNRINLDLTGFANLSSELTYRHKEAVARAVVLLQRYPELTLHITGHTDQYGSDPLNHMLSEARARAVYLDILKYGLIDQSRISIEGLGSTNLLSTENTEEAHQMNRRAEVNVPVQESATDWLAAFHSTDRIELTQYDELPVNSGDEIVFDWLDIRNKEQAAAWLHSIAGYLAENPNSRVLIDHVVNYQTGSAAFIQEIEKARSELLKDLLMTIGVNSSRIEIAGTAPDLPIVHDDLIESENNTEMTWFYILD